jgi:PilZ domain
MNSEKRAKIRRSVRQGGRIVAVDGLALGACMMVDVSASGARLVLATSDPLPGRFFLILSRDGALRRLCSVAWQTETKAGVQFIFG